MLEILLTKSLSLNDTAFCDYINHSIHSIIMIVSLNVKRFASPNLKTFLYDKHHHFVE
jgi:hypothetical protein